MARNYKISLTVVATLDERALELYRDVLNDVVENLVFSERSKVTIEETTEPAQVDWSIVKS